MQYEPLTRNTEFSRAYRRGKSYVSPFLVTYVLKKKKGGMRVGITTSKKIGGAVQRSRARRVIRAAFSEIGPDQGQRVDLVFVARGATTRVKMQKVRGVMQAQLAAAGLLGPVRQGAPATAAAAAIAAAGGEEKGGQAPAPGAVGTAGAEG